MVVLAMRYKIVITCALGMHGIYGPQPSRRAGVKTIILQYCSHVIMHYETISCQPTYACISKPLVSMLPVL